MESNLQATPKKVKKVPVPRAATLSTASVDAGRVTKFNRRNNSHLVPVKAEDARVEAERGADNPDNLSPEDLAKLHALNDRFAKVDGHDGVFDRLACEQAARAGPFDGEGVRSKNAGGAALERSEGPDKSLFPV